MIPDNLKVLGNCIIRHPFVPRLSDLIIRLQRTGVFISFIIVGQSGKSPRTFGKDISRHFQVHDVTDSKIISAFCQTETTTGVVHISRHDETGRIAAGEREEKERNSQRQRYIFHHQIGRSRHYILFRTHLGPCQLHIEVRMVMVVTSRIAPMLHKNFIIGPLLGFASGHVSFPLLSYDFGDSRFFSFEVIPDSFRIISGISLFKYRFTFFHSQRVFDTVGVHRTAIQIH